MLVRRLWLAPTVLFLVTLYFVYYSRLRNHAYQVPLDSNTARLRPRPPLYPVSSFIPLPSGQAQEIPRIQYDFSKKPETPDLRRARLERQSAIQESFQHAWEGYKRQAWAKDEVAPVSGNWRDSFGGWGATLIDTMDTLWIMGMKQDFELCVEFVKTIDFTTNTESSLNVFETTIRYLGGLLAAYDISDQQYPILLKKATELGNILYMAFDTPNHMPVTRWEWKHTAAGKEIHVSSNVLIAEMASLTLEFTRLAQLTHDPKYFDAVQRISEHLIESQNRTRIPGLWPILVNAQNMEFNFNHFTFGGMADSAFEYLPKQHLLLGGLDPRYGTMYTTAIEAAQKHLFYRPMTPNGENVLFSGNAIINGASDITLEPQAQHLTCFVGGMVGIGARIFSRPAELEVARKLVEGCIFAYDQLPSGLMPEVSWLVPCHTGISESSASAQKAQEKACTWSDEKYYTHISSKIGVTPDTESMTPSERGKRVFHNRNLVKPFTELTDNRYILRPEAIESIFILYRITGDPSLLESAWRMYKHIESATRTEIAHAEVNDVRQTNPPKIDRMESFWLAETLKYFWLIFSDPKDVNLDEWVFNTEAHPFRRPKAGETLVR